MSRKVADLEREIHEKREEIRRSTERLREFENNREECEAKCTRLEKAVEQERKRAQENLTEKEIEWRRKLVLFFNND